MTDSKDLLHPSDTRTPTPRDSELGQYVDAFRLSSTRSRVALYVVVIATALMGVTNYNVQPWSLPRQRLRTWFEYKIWEAKPATPTTPPAIVAQPVIPDKIMGGDARLLQAARDEFEKQFVARSVFTSSPIPGVSIDVNDLGILGGSALTLLMLVLLVCLMREHENLYLALYKVRQFARDQNHEHGSSEANLLYHALVMSQVLASPPTLARWRNRGTLRHFGFIYILPLATYLWVICTNYRSLPIAAIYVGEASARRFMTVQYGIASVLFIVTVLSLLNSSAMAARWITAFRAINPVRERLPQMSFIEWLRIPMRNWITRRVPFPGIDPHCHARTVTEIVDTLRETAKTTLNASVSNVCVRKIRHRISRRQLSDMTHKLCEAGIGEAGASLTAAGIVGNAELLSFTTKSNVIENGVWKIDGEWQFEVRTEATTPKSFWRKLWPWRSNAQ
jgi:hypothetical protein